MSARLCAICDNYLIADDWGEKDLICPICCCGCIYDCEEMDDGGTEPAIQCYEHESWFWCFRRWIPHVSVSVQVRHGRWGVYSR